MLNVSALPDRVQNQASALKATFDRAGVDIKEALNALIVELEDATSANNIGADVGSVATKTVQAILTAFETEISDRYTKTETETLVANDTNNLVADVDVNLTTGVITVTKKDGTTETFDTALEKVPAKFEVVENSGSYVLKITNMDGTVTQADITQFMNVYNFGNSNEIAFDVIGTGNEKTVTATIRANSIGLDKLSLTVVSTLEEYVNSAKDSATAAKTSETNAKTSEINAQNAATTATNSASTATTKANEAKKSADDAEYWAKQAQAGGGGGGITEIPVATADTLGGIKVGEGLDITVDGVLSAVGGGTSGSERVYGKWTMTGSSNPTDTIAAKPSALNTMKSSANGNPIFEPNKVYMATVFVNAVNYSTTSGRLSLSIEVDSTSYGLAYILPVHLNYGTTPTMMYLPFIGKFDVEKEGIFKGVVSGTVSKDVTAYTIDVFIEELGGTNGNYIINGDELSVDNVPTEGSTNLVTSGGVKTYVDNKAGLRKFVGTQENPIDFTDLFDGMGNATDGWHQGSALGNCVLSGYVKTANGAETLSSLIFGNAGLVAEIVVAYIYMYAEGVYDPPVLMCTVQNDVSLIGFTAIAGQGFAAFNGEAKLVTKDELDNRIQSSTTDLTAGTSELATGALYFVYE